MRAFRLFILAISGVATAIQAQAVSPRTMQVVWRAGAGADPDSSFAVIASMAVSPGGDVIVWDPRTPALRLFNDAGKFIRTIGRKGAGPGEYNGINGIAYDKSGAFYAWDSGNGRLNVYKRNGDFDRQVRLPIRNFGTSNALSIDTLGRAWLRFVLFDHAAGSSQGAWIRIRTSDGSTIDTVKQPTLEGSDPQLVARNGGSMASYSIPYGRYASFALTASGDIMTAAAGKYEISVPHRGKTVKITRAYTPVPVSSAERNEQKEITEKGLRRTQPDWSWPPTGIPTTKPPLQAIAGGLDGRVWAMLHVESEKFTPEAPATREAGAPPPATFRSATKKWDVFEADGRYLGTVSASRNVFPYVMRGDFAWGMALDDDDLPTLVKLRIGPGFGSR